MVTNFLLFRLSRHLSLWRVFFRSYQTFRVKLSQLLGYRCDALLSPALRANWPSQLAGLHL